VFKLIITSALIAVLAVFAACNDDDDDDTTGGDDTSSTPSVCDQKDAVESAVTDLADIDVLAEGTDALNENVANVKTELADLKSIVSDDVQPEVEAMETAVSDAEDILADIGDDATLNEKIDDVQTALTGIVTASDNLATALDSECG
jgi:predicted  nucleic acid-binding Zn-ribbon protein